MTLKLSEARAAKRAEIELHGDYALDRHMAINVKYRGPWPTQPADCDDARWEYVCSQAFDRACEDFWLDAEVIAQEHGYTDVFSEGRSGGWLVPYWQSRPVGMRYMGQGGKLGYPRYPDPENLADRVQFLAFQTDILDRLSAVPMAIADYVADILEIEQEYPA